jgi:RHS repeat-associated protein
MFSCQNPRSKENKNLRNSLHEFRRTLTSLAQVLVNLIALDLRRAAETNKHDLFVECRRKDFMKARTVQSLISSLVFISVSILISPPTAKADTVIDPLDWVLYDYSPPASYYEFPERTFIAQKPGIDAYFRVGSDSAPVIGPDGISFTLGVEKTFSLSAFHALAVDSSTREDLPISVTLQGNFSTIHCSGSDGLFSQSGGLIRAQGIFVCTNDTPPPPAVGTPVTLKMTNYTILSSFPTPTPTPTPPPTPTPDPTLSQPTDVESPSGGSATDPAQNTCPATESGSIIHVDNRSLGEKVDVVGAPFSLYYFSDRMRSGTGSSNTIHIPLVPSTPNGLLAVVLNVQYGNRTFNQIFPPVPGFSYDFVWDGKDEFGNPASGPLPAYIAVVYLLSDGTAPYALSIVNLGGSGTPGAETGLGGWTPSNHHRLDVASKTIHYGYGISWPVEPIAYNNGILVSSSDGSEAYLFDLNGRHLETRNALTNALVMSFQYDQSGLLVSETDAFGNKTLINHNGSIPTSIVSPYGQVTQLSVDQNGYLSRIANPAGNVYQMSYSANGLLQTFTKPNGHTSQMTYDAQGKLVKDLGAAGDSSTFSESVVNGIKTIQKLTSMNRETLYTSSSDGTNSSRSTRLPNGEVTNAVQSPNASQSTTSQNLVVQSTHVDDERFGSMAPLTASVQSSIANTSFSSRSESTQSVSIKNGDVLEVNQLVRSVTVDSDPRQTYQTKYDGSTRTGMVITPEGKTTKVIYNQLGQIASTQAGQLTQSTYSYDSRGRLVSILQGSRKSLISYNAQGNISTIQNPLNLKTSIQYDPAGRVTQETRPDGKSVKYSYDTAGNLVSLTPANNFVHQFSVNLADDLSGYLPPKVGSVSTGSTFYSYNPDRQMTRVTQPDGSSVNYDYDMISGQLLSVAGSKGSISLNYDSNTKQLSHLQTNDDVGTGFEYVGPLKTKEMTSSAAGSHSLNFEYANNMKLSSLSLNSRAGLERAIDLRYDRDQRPVQIGDERFVFDSQSGLLKSSSIGVISQNLNYNSFGEQTVDTYKVGSKQIYSAEMVRNALGQITQRTEVVNGKKVRFNYTYDNLSRLTSMKTNGLPVLSYSYDVNGNRVSASALFGLIKIKEKYDEQDRLISMGDVTYSYDAMGNRIKKSIPLTKKKSNDTLYSYNSFGQLKSVTLPNGKQIEYLIDGLGRRIGKKVNGKLVQGFIYQSQAKIAAETDGSGKVVKRFIYGVRPNVPDYMITKDGTFRLITDQVGTLRMIVDTSNGKIVDESVSTAFGEINLDCKRFLTPFGFAGGLYDRDTGLVHFGARDYDPQVGRWISKDPIRFAGGDTNLFGYTLNDPVNRIDPSGLYSCTYSISTHSMKCTPNNMDNPTYSSDTFVSGNNGGKNNPDATDIPFVGPIPVGDYEVGPQNPGTTRRNLTPLDGTDTQGRDGFQTHGCGNPDTCSEGCIAATTNTNRQLLNYLFGLEEGNNVIHVVP